MQRRKQSTNNELWLRSKNWPIVCICADHEQRMFFKFLKGCKKEEKEKKKEKQERGRREGGGTGDGGQGGGRPRAAAVSEAKLALKTKNIY